MRGKRARLWSVVGVLGLSLAWASVGGAAPTSLPDCSTVHQDVGSGSWVLGGNQAAAANDDCWILTGDNITIDLQGFTVTGSGATGSGITQGANNFKNITIRNGTISGFGDYGIALGGSSVIQIDRIRAVGNGQDGILVGGGSSVTNSRAYQNTFDGINCGFGCIVSGNTARFNGRDGIVVNPDSTISGNTASSNGGDGIQVHRYSTITGNTASSNTGSGINVLFCPSNLVGNTAQNNTGGDLVKNGAGCKSYNNLF